MAGQIDRSDEITKVANTLLQSKDLRLKSYRILQRLWAGYGNICHVEASSIKSRGSEDLQSFILKHVTPPADSRDAALDEGHLRKLVSYQVEQYFYTHLAPAMPLEIAVAQCMGSVNEHIQAGISTIALVLTDLREQFPIAGERRGVLNEQQMYAALKWLAKFHGFWWTRTQEIRDGNLRLPPLQDVEPFTQRTDGVWLNGGYTYLATRRKEYVALKNDLSSSWSAALCQDVDGTNHSIAELVAIVLSPAPSQTKESTVGSYETLIHGDVKSENLFANTAGSAVAFFDFQYVGLGLGVCDIAKLFTCSIPVEMLVENGISEEDFKTLDMDMGERKLLEFYQHVIHEVSGKRYPWHDIYMHWNTALVDWLRFQASWGFWGNTRWLEARVRHILKDRDWLKWLLDAASQT